MQHHIAINVPATADIVIADDKTLIFAEYNAEIDVNLPWTGTTHVIRYDPQGNRILDTDINLDGNYSETLLRGEFVFLMDVSSTSISNHNSSDGKLPGHFSLFQNYPNPVNPTTTIEYALPGAEHINLRIYNVNGQLVKTLTNEEKEAAYHSVVWDGRNEQGVLAPSGIYFYNIEAGEYVQTRKMVMLK